MTPLFTEDRWLNPIWAIRILPAAATLLLAMAMIVFRVGPIHSAFLGGALGLLIGFCAFLTGIERVVLRERPQPSDAEPYSIR